MKSENKRSIAARIWLTADEAASIAALAGVTGLSLSEFFRRAALGREIHAPRPLPEINRATYSELGRISGNLQRLFTVLTAGQKLPPDMARQLVQGLVAVKRACQQTQQQIIGGGHD